MAKIWRVNDGETTEIKDLMIENSPKALVDPMAVKMFVLCMKTAEDFIQLSKYLDSLPFIDTSRNMRHGDRFFGEREIIFDDEDRIIAFSDEYKRRGGVKTTTTGYRSFHTQTTHLYECKMSYNPEDRLYEYVFEITNNILTVMLEVFNFIKNLSIDIYHSHVLSVELDGGQTIMPMKDGFTIKVHSGFTRFAIEGPYWFPGDSGISELKIIKNLTFKSYRHLTLPIKIVVSFEAIDTFINFRDWVMQKNKIVKDGKYWQNIRMNGGECWKSETVRYD